VPQVTVWHILTPGPRAQKFRASMLNRSRHALKSLKLTQTSLHQGWDCQISKASTQINPISARVGIVQVPTQYSLLSQGFCMNTVRSNEQQCKCKCQ